MSPTFDLPRRAAREYARLSPEAQRAFDIARREFVAGLRHDPPRFAPRLRVKRVRGYSGVWELSFGDGGRATFQYGEEQRVGEPHVTWRRIGDHGILRDP